MGSVNLDRAMQYLHYTASFQDQRLTLIQRAKDTWYTLIIDLPSCLEVLLLTARAGHEEWSKRLIPGRVYIGADI
jgi:hypothetical protein